MTENICDQCGNNCDIKCAAWKALYDVYQETRHKDRHQLIKKYGRNLGIVDAEPDKDMSKLARIILDNETILDMFPELCVIREYNIKVGFVLSQERPPMTGGKIKRADCQKLKWTYKAYLPFDFIITFYEANIDTLSENQRKILMLHELLHIGVGEKGLKLVEHDTEDFEKVLGRYGLGWGKDGADVPDILEKR